MSKVLDGVASWLADSHGSTLRLEAVVTRIIIIYIGYMGCHDRTELDGFRQESKLQVCNLYLGDYFHQISARSMIGT